MNHRDQRNVINTTNLGASSAQRNMVPLSQLTNVTVSSTDAFLGGLAKLEEYVAAAPLCLPNGPRYSFSLQGDEIHIQSSDKNIVHYDITNPKNLVSLQVGERFTRLEFFANESTITVLLHHNKVASTQRSERFETPRMSYPYRESTSTSRQPSKQSDDHCPCRDGE